MAKHCTAYYPVQYCAKWCNATEQQACARQDLLDSCSNEMPAEPCLPALHQLGSITPVREHCTSSELV